MHYQKIRDRVLLHKDSFIDGQRDKQNSMAIMILGIAVTRLIATKYCQCEK